MHYKISIIWISKVFGTRSASDSGVFRFFFFFNKYLHRIYWLNIPNPQEQTPTSYINQEVDAFNLDNEE